MAIDPKKEGPYHGAGFFFFFGLLLPVLLLVIFNLSISAFRHMPAFGNEYIFWESFAFAFGIGTVFTLIVFIAGSLKIPFQKVRDRVSMFFDDIRYSAKEAFKWWWYSIKEDGIMFWIEILFFITEALLTLYALKQCLPYIV